MLERECPWCKDEECRYIDVISYYGPDKKKLYHLRCEKCECTGPVANLKEDAYTLWNRR